MKAISQRVCFLVIATGLGVLTAVYSFITDLTMHQLQWDSLLVVAISTTVCLLGFLICENRKLKIARLIIENTILYIQLATIDVCNGGETDNLLPSGGIEVSISCFGILLDAKVIKFNVEGIQLKAVEIGRQFICLTYGKAELTQKIRILHEVISNKELESIVERFRHEIGVVSVLTD
ncbi:MAG: hypothetical protein P4L59_07115 [Desulfosporosinus sp.]|nr:hypothetical protein [Desulfosporosinus sp.]